METSWNMLHGHAVKTQFLLSAYCFDFMAYNCTALVQSLHCHQLYFQLQQDDCFEERSLKRPLYTAAKRRPTKASNWLVNVVAKI